MTWKSLTTVLAGLVLVALAACSPTPSSRPEDTVTVFAAASLTKTFTELGKTFEAEHAGVTVSFNFAGSSDLVAQIQQGAPADVFASADEKKDVEGVFVLAKDGKVEFRKVKTGITAELQIEVVEGLKEGEEIVSGPFRALRARRIGDRVKVDNSGVPRDEKKS